MSRRTNPFVAGVLLLSACLPAAAQTAGSDRPFRGALFGSFRTEQTPQTLDLSAMVLEAYDDNLLATLGGNVDPRSRPASGFYSMLLPGVDYKLTHRRFQIGVTGASAFAYYPDVHEIKSISHNMGAGFSLHSGPRTAILLNQTAAYSPSYLYGLFPGSSKVSPGDPAPDAPNYAVNDLESFSYGTTATLSHELTSRTIASVVGDLHYTDYTHETLSQQDRTSRDLGAQFSYRRTRNLALQFSYNYSTGNLAFGGSANANENRLGGGISYSRPLSATRRMTFNFSIGASALSSSGAPAEGRLPDRLYRATADASIEYPFARVWRTTGNFRRGLEFVPGLAQPVYSNGVYAGLDGLLNRRIEIGFGGGYAQGQPALTTSASQYDTYTGSARLQYALATSTAIHVEYLYYFYDFLGDVLVVSGAPQRMTRNGVRVGVRLLVPSLKG